MKGILQGIDLLAVQDETYAGRFRELGAVEESLRVTGSMKYDGAETERQNEGTTRLARLWGIREDDVVFLAGSTQEPEEELALETYLQLSESHPELRLILVPRHPDRFERVAEMLDERGVRWQRRTELDGAAIDSEARILLVNVIGELGAWWGTAAVAYVGGSMGPRGGQNMIEPAAYGAAVSFGPNTRNFRDIVSAMLARDAAIVVHNGDEMTTFVRRCVDEPGFRDQLGWRAHQLVQEQLGATGRTFALLESLVGSASSGSVPAPMGLKRSEQKSGRSF